MILVVCPQVIQKFCQEGSFVRSSIAMDPLPLNLRTDFVKLDESVTFSPTLEEEVKVHKKNIQSERGYFDAFIINQIRPRRSSWRWFVNRERLTPIFELIPLLVELRLERVVLGIRRDNCSDDRDDTLNSVPQVIVPLWISPAHRLKRFCSRSYQRFLLHQNKI